MRNRDSLIRERREAFRDARLIVIASEGKDTERIYFKALAKEYENPRVHVRTLERCEEEQQLWLRNRRKSKNMDPYLKVRLRQVMGSYHESSYDVQTLMEHVEKAIERARTLDRNPADRWPQTLGTRVYLLAESIMDRR